MTEINEAIKKSVKIISKAIKTEYPNIKTKELGTKINELVFSSIANDGFHSVEILASDSMPEFNLAADALAMAHSMYKANDKENAIKMVIYAFNSPDCSALIRGILALNEEAVEIVATTNKQLGDFSDIQNFDPDRAAFGGDNPYANDLDHMGVEDIIESPSIRDQEQLESDLTDAGSRAPYANTAEEDDEIEGVPPGDVTVLASLKKTEKLLTAYAKSYKVNSMNGTDAVPGFDDNMQSDSYNDPAIDPDINLDNVTPEFQGAPQMTPLDFNFEEAVENVGSGPFNSGNGIDDTVMNNPDSPGEYNERADSPGDSAQLDPEYDLIASITDPSIKAAVKLLVNKNTPESKQKLRAFLTYYKNIQQAA